jgi:hypothetical protein
MEITISLQAVAIIIATIFPFFFAGLTKFISELFLKSISLKAVEKIVDADVELRKSMATLSAKRYYFLVVIIPIFEELLFRVLPVWLLYYAGAELCLVIMIGIITSVLFGTFHYWNHKSFMGSIVIQGTMGCVLFAAYFLFSEAFGIWIAFGMISVLHLLHNFLFGSLLSRPSIFDNQDWKVRHYYEVLTNRDFEKEFDKEVEEMLKQEEEFEKMIGHTSEVVTSG